MYKYTVQPSSPVVNTRLAGLTAREAGRDDADQDPAAVLLAHHERAAAVPLAGVFATRLIPGAHHLGVEDDGDAPLAVPRLAQRVLHKRHVHHLREKRKRILVEAS
jgi:hypothetical protein